MKRIARPVSLLLTAGLLTTLLIIPAAAKNNPIDWDSWDWDDYYSYDSQTGTSGSSSGSTSGNTSDTTTGGSTSGNTSDTTTGDTGSGNTSGTASGSTSAAVSPSGTASAADTSASGSSQGYSAFTDLPAGASYRDAVSWCIDNGIMNGMGSGLFKPDTTLNRAMLVTILYRLEGSPAVTYANTFSDISGTNSQQDWYRSAVAWAVSQNITTGYTDGTFQPDKAVSRQELAVFLARYAGLKGYDTAGFCPYDDLKDGSTTGSWASAQVGWALYWGVLEETDGTLRPAEGATRAEVCTAVYAFSSLAAAAQNG